MINIKKIALGAIGLAISGIFIYITNNLIDWSKTWLLMKNSSIEWLILSSLTIFAGCLARATRWWIISDQPTKNPIIFMKITLVGYMCNFLLPFRAGEFIRIWLLARLTNLNALQATICSLADRGTDLILYSVMIAITFFLFPLPEEITFAKDFSYAFLVFTISFLIVFIIFKKNITNYFNSLARKENKIIKLFGNILINFYRSIKLVVIEKPFKMILLITLIGILDFTGVYFVTIALNWQIPFSASIIFTIMIAFGASLPSAPGYIGIYQVAAIVSFGLFGIDPDNAVAHSILLQGLTAFSYFLAGLVALLLILPKLTERTRT
tara:strand:- start:1139 stop:2110 length:972 start_codon:yes stop_codon:yes gene_type:complete